MSAPTRKQQKDLIREVLREQAAASAGGASQPATQPPAKKARATQFSDRVVDRRGRRRNYTYADLVMAVSFEDNDNDGGICPSCDEWRLHTRNFVACCGCADCNCLVHRLLNREFYRHNISLHEIHQDAAVRRASGDDSSGSDHDSDSDHDIDSADDG